MENERNVVPADALRERLRGIRDRMRNSRNWRDLKALLLRVAILLLAGWILSGWIFLFAQASENSMYPAVKAGDLLIGYRLQKTYSKNDVVLYEQDGKLCVGRVLGRANDLIALDDSGTLMVNGSAQGGEILFPTYAREGLEYPCTVPEGCVFILGDYRTQATDSRDFGPVSLTQVRAKVITLLRRRGL